MDILIQFFSDKTWLCTYLWYWNINLFIVMKNTHKIITYCTIEWVCYMYLTNLCYCIWNLIYLKRNKWPHQFELFYGEEKLYLGSWKIMMLNRIHVLYHKSLSNWLLKGVSNPVHFDISPKLKSCFSCHVIHTDSACFKYLL